MIGLLILGFLAVLISGKLTGNSTAEAFKCAVVVVGVAVITRVFVAFPLWGR